MATPVPTSTVRPARPHATPPAVAPHGPEEDAKAVAEGVHKGGELVREAGHLGGDVLAREAGHLGGDVLVRSPARALAVEAALVRAGRAEQALEAAHVVPASGLGRLALGRVLGGVGLLLDGWSITEGVRALAHGDAYRGGMALGAGVSGLAAFAAPFVVGGVAGAGLSAVLLTGSLAFMAAERLGGEAHPAPRP